MGIFGKLFKKKSNSQPQLNNKTNQPPKSNIKSTNNTTNQNNSAPNLATLLINNRNNQSKQQSQSNLKSFGELNPYSIDSDDENDTKTKSYPKKTVEIKNENDINEKSISLIETSKKSISGGYESSSSSEDSDKGLEILDTIVSNSNINDKPKKNLLLVNPDISEDSKSITSISTHYSTQTPRSLADQIRNRSNLTKKSIGSLPLKSTNDSNVTFVTNDASLVKSNTNLSVTFKEPNLNETKLNETRHSINNINNASSETIKKLVKNAVSEPNSIEDLKNENKHLRDKLENLQLTIQQIESKNKQETDRLIIKLHDALSNDMKTESEKIALSKVLLSKQQESNEKLINEQAKVIETLSFKCKKLESDLIKPNQAYNEKALNLKIKNQNEEIDNLKNIISRLSNELNVYLSKNPNAKKLNSDQVVPQLKFDTNQIFPLITAYDEKFNEKDEKIKLLKIKLDDLQNKFKMILEENEELQSKLGQIPESENHKMNQMSNLAKLVLEENKLLGEKLVLEDQKCFDLQQKHLQEIGRLSKRIVISESDKLNLQNQIDIYRSASDEILRKYNDLSVEFQKRIDLQEHLNKIGDLKNKIEEMGYKQKQEMENLILIQQSLQNEKSELTNKQIDLIAENKKLVAQNQVLENALVEGRKTQQKINDLEKKIEIAELKEKTAIACIEKLTKHNQKIKKEREKIENLINLNEIDAKQKENRLVEETLKLSKLEEKFEDYKEKTSKKLAKTVEKLEKKDNELILIKIESEKKITELLKLLQKKQGKIDQISKKYIDDSSENPITSDNQKLKEFLLDFKAST